MFRFCDWIAGLDSIVFAVTVDNPELNSVRSITNTVTVSGGSVVNNQWEDELRPVIAGDTPTQAG